MFSAAVKKTIISLIILYSDFEDIIKKYAEAPQR